MARVSDMMIGREYIVLPHIRWSKMLHGCTIVLDEINSELPSAEFRFQFGESRFFANRKDLVGLEPVAIELSDDVLEFLED